MDNSLDTLAYARQPLLDALAQMFTLYGWPEVAGRIYGLLRLEDDPLSLDEISDYLAVSKATASTHVRMLESLYMVRRVRGPQASEGASGRPRAYFDAERDSSKVIRELMRNSDRREMEIMKRGIVETRSRLQNLGDAIVSDPDLRSDVVTDLEAIDDFDVYIRWGSHMLWMVQNVERMQMLMDEVQGQEAVLPSALGMGS